MGLFKGKPKMTVEDFCEAFYDSRFFNTKTVSYLRETEEVPKDSWASHLDVLKKMVAEADQSFSSVDTNLLRQEITALHMGVFALEFTIRVKLKLEDMVREVLFTKHYLEHNQRVDLWHVLLDYNDVIDHSVFMNDDGRSAELDSAWKRGWSAFLIDPKDADMNSAWARGRVTFMNTYRWGLFEEWIKSNVADPQSPTDEEKEKLQCLSIALKRVGADIRHPDSVAVRLLNSRLVGRLGCVSNLNAQARFIMAASVFGFFKIAKNHLKSVTLQ